MSDTMLDGMLNALAWPQEKLKETVSGDKEEWFSPEGMPSWAYAAGNTALDLIADPLNLIPVGLLGKAAKAVPLDKLKGNAMASAPNYIKNFYGLTDGPALPTGPELAAMKTIPLPGMLDQEKLGLVRKARGMAEWGTTGALGAAKSVISPKARALYADTGINKASQDTVKRHMKRGGDPKAQAKATAQVNYNQHIVEQSGRVGQKAESMKTIGDRSNLEDYTPNHEGTVAGWMQKNSGTVTGPRGGVAKDVMSPDEASYIEKHITSSWGTPNTVVMKRPRTAAGGNHFNDLYKKSPLTSVVSAAFQKYKGEPTLRELYDTLTKMQTGQKGRNKFMVKNPDFADVEKNGLWLKGSIAGSAITEGGVNWLSKVEPSGKLTGIISDKHDFLEKLPGVGKVLAESLPKELVAMTPPMRANIQSLRSTQFEKMGKRAKKQYSGVPSPKLGPKDPKTNEVLQQYTEAEGTLKSLRAEQMRQGGLATAPLAASQGGTNQPREEQQ